MNETGHSNQTYHIVIKDLGEQALRSGECRCLLKARLKAWRNSAMYAEELGERRPCRPKRFLQEVLIIGRLSLVALKSSRAAIEKTGFQKLAFLDLDAHQELGIKIETDKRGHSWICFSKNSQSPHEDDMTI